MSLYIYETGGDPSSDGIEPYMFLSRLRSPLYWRNGMYLSRKDMTDIGFEVLPLYKSTLKINARKVEAELQSMYHYLPFGHIRLWKYPDMGAKCDQNFNEKRMFHAGITYHPDLEPLIAKGIGIVNDKKRDINKDDHRMTFSTESKDDLRKEALDLLEKEKVHKRVQLKDSESGKGTKHTQLKDRGNIMNFMNQKQVGNNAVSRNRLIQHPWSDMQWQATTQPE